MPQEITHATLDNGLTLIVQPMSHVQSAAFAILTPAGTIYEQPERNGTAAALTDLIMRGAGDRDSQQLIGTLDSLGVQAHEHTGWNFLSFTGATIASRIDSALELYGDVLLRPRLPQDQFSAVMSGIEQNLMALEDEPQRKVFIELRKRVYDSPWSRPSDGSLEELANISYDDICHHFTHNVRPNGTLIGIAGNVDPDNMLAVVERTFGSWKRQPAPEIISQPPQLHGEFLAHPSAQTHIGLAFPAVPYGDPEYYAASAAVSVLSGGSSSRLFTEVREKRGLCYSVDASLSSLKKSGHVLAYAGTTTERAQETLDVMLEVIHGLGRDISEAELARCKARDKSSLVMQQESTPSRASAIARDWFYLERVQSLQEIRQKIDALQVEDLVTYLERHPAEPLAGFCVGERSLNFHH
ncbi:MAG: insulinase family protein [Planctomycetaceae bacterium]|nr:insulinase family protein [Planctomycetaceae bacterium]